MAALSSEFHAYLEELEKTKNWEKLPHDDPRIVELQRLSNLSGTQACTADLCDRVEVYP